MAAGKPAVKVTGAREFRDAMRRMGGDLKDLTAIHKRAAEDVAAGGRTRAPYDTGMLAGTITARATTTKGYVLAGGRTVPYAGVIHYGWPARNIEAQPFLTDSLDDRKDAIVGMYEAHIEALVEKVARETPP